MNTKEFGLKLIEIRNGKGLTQDQLADACNINVRTIQRIESGLVKPRAYTIKVISETLAFDFFQFYQTDGGPYKEGYDPNLKDSVIPSYFKELFNLKTNTMKKVSILVASSMAIFLFMMFISSSLNAQFNEEKIPSGLTITFNKDKTPQKVQFSASNNLTLDSLVDIQERLAAIDIIIQYKKLVFDDSYRLKDIEADVKCDMFGGAFAITDLGNKDMDDGFGFYRDYSEKAKSKFGTGLLRDRR